MKRVGILTFHSVRNFGAVVQAWSTPQILRSLGVQPEVIDYRPSGHAAKQQRSGLRRFVPSIGGLRSDRFVRRHLPLSDRVFNTHDAVDRYVRSGRFDALLTGSDQVWYRNDYLGFDRVYFLDIGDPGATARLSYAPSAGPISDLGSERELATRILGTYKAVSVRDANTLTLVRSLGRADAVEVLDPTLVADLRPLVGPSPMREPYLLITGAMSEKAYALLAEIAQRERLKVIEIGRACRFADQSRPFVDPGEWVTYIAHAALVASSLFHGCAVSISLRRPFIALDTAGRGFKLQDLLSRLGMTDRLLTSEQLSAGLAPREAVSFDYGHVNTGIELARQRSIAFLNQAIHG